MDLHAHLNLKSALGWLQRGDFDSPAQSDDWKSRWKTKAGRHDLVARKSPTLIVASLYGHTHVSEHWSSPWQARSEPGRRQNVQATIEAQYQQLQKFFQSQSQWVLAKTPIEAENLISDGKTPVVLSIEGAWGTLDTPEQQELWIQERGVAIVTFAHLTGDDLSGTALFSNWIAGFNAPLQFLAALWNSGGRCLWTFCRSPEGMSPLGKTRLDELTQRGVWLDWSHANDATLAQIRPWIETTHQPFLMTHTSPRAIYPAERGLSSDAMEWIRQFDGMVGLMPTNDMLHLQWQQRPCFSGLVEFRETVHQMIRALGPERVTLASDVNAPVSGLSPLCQVAPGQLTSTLEKEGFYRYSQWTELSQYVAPDPQWVEASQKHFIQLWKKVARRHSATN